MYSSTLKMLCLPSVPNQEPEKNTINISGVFLSAGSFCAFLATNSVIRPRQFASLFASCISRNAFTDTHSRRRVGWGWGGLIVAMDGGLIYYHVLSYLSM